MEILSVSGLTKRYPGFTLNGAAFTVEKGEIMGLIGRNGAGKSTTLKSLTGLIHPDGGDIRFFGLPLAGNEREIRRRMAYMSGGVDYYQRKKLKAITAVSRDFYEDRWDDSAYRRFMSLFSLSEDKTPAQLSAGMRVKYSLTLAMSHRAELLILDEPTSGLDPVSRDEIVDAFLKLQREGVSILFSTHITADLEKCADRLTYISRGRVLACEPLKAFTARYRFVQMADVPDALRPRMIGLKQAKEGFTALISGEDAEALRVDARPAMLEEIMVHLEKENEQ